MALTGPALPHPLPDSSAPPAGERIGPYVVERFIARGGMATVLAVRDTRTGEEQALKLLLPLSLDRDGLVRFRREFRALKRLTHPNVLQVYEWGLFGTRPWYSMELIEQGELATHLPAWRDLPAEPRWSRVRAVLVQAARALAFVHDRGLVHRDVSPTNLLLRPDGTLALSDFGIVKELGSDLTTRGDRLGTVAYIAPEQIRGEPLDGRADLYALGGVLYLMLTGRKPFQALTLQGCLDKHLNTPPKPPRSFEPGVPEDLEAICLRLLEKAPRDRYASATHLLHVLGDLPTDDLEVDRFPPRIIGRRRVRAQLHDAVDVLADHGRGGAVLLSAPDGHGKTRLLDVAEQLARRRGLAVGRGKCRHQDRPFGAFGTVFHALRGPHADPLLVDLFDHASDDGPRERYPVLAAFRQLLVEAGPALVMLDDLDLADGATLELLDYLLRNTLRRAEHPVLFVLAERVTDTHPATDSALAQHLGRSSPLRHERLGPLELAEVEELVLSMVHASDAAIALAARLHGDSGGSPAFVTDMLRTLLDEGVLVTHGDRLKVEVAADRLASGDLPMPPSLRDALLERLSPLPTAALDLGRVLAIARRRLTLDTLVAAAPLDEEGVMAALDVLAAAGIVEEQRQDAVQSVELSHSRFRDVLLEELSPSSLRHRHQRMGEVLERVHRGRRGAVVEELTFHFEQAGVAPKAYAYLVHTARRHLNASLFEEALQFLDRSLRMEPAARPQMLLDDADRRLAEVHLYRAQCLYHLGRWALAYDDAQRAEAIARELDDPALLSRVAAELGVHLRNQGDMARAESRLREAVAFAEASGDASLRPMPLYQLGALFWTRGDLEGAERCWSEALSTAQQAGDERAQGYGFNGLGILAVCRGDAMDARRHLEASSKLFARLGMLPALAIARVNLAELYQSTGVLKKALRLADATIDQAREVRHPYGLALGLTHRSRVLRELGRLDEARANADEALDLVRELGDLEDEVLVLATLAELGLAEDDLDAAEAALADLAPLLDRHDAEGIAPLVIAWRAECQARRGQLDEAHHLVMEAARTPVQWPHVGVRTDLALASAWQRLGEREQARKTLQRALASAESNGYRFYQLLAHQGLVHASPDEPSRTRHGRVASALARSLAANLPSDDAARFLARGWGA